MNGKLIVLYGVNNLGKSTQAKRLVDALNAEGKETVYLKYPLYDLAPSGPLLNSYLREGNPHGFSAREAQLLYILNRTQYDETLRNILASGKHVVAEDYVGTGVAWGVAAGVAMPLLENMNGHLLREDIVCLFEGERFLTGVEHGHLHEKNNELTDRVAITLNALATKHDWHHINANQSIESVHADVMRLIHSTLAD